jgi:hypothetical protein
MLKNRGATYQKCIHIILEPQIGGNVAAYIDDVVGKSKKCEDMLDDLKETFDNARKYKMMLNPKKCVLGVSSGKLLSYMVSLGGNRREPKEGGSHQTITITSDPKRNPETSRHDGSTQPIHIKVERTWYVFLQATMKSRWIPVG